MSADLNPEEGRDRRKQFEEFLQRLSLLYTVQKIVREFISSL